MARKRSSRAAAKARARSHRSARWMILVVVCLVAVAPSLHRSWWRWGERSEVGAAVDALRSHGCLTCHPRSGDGFRWRGDGDSPRNTTVIRDSLERGRPGVPGMPGSMPAYATRVGKGTLERLVFGAEVCAGLTGAVDEPEVRIGLTIAAEMGCFDCHGPMGAGGVANPGTVGGWVPGFYGASFALQSESLDGIEGIVRDGRTARKAWWTPWKRPALDMPAYGDRLDSIEIELLAHAIRSLSEQDS
ncbi:MAG: hypothetical protein ABFS37_10775 [Acidobacteriota bacterium]